MGEGRSGRSAEGAGLIENLRRWARAIKRDVHAVWLCARDRRTPPLAKAIAFVTAAYALSPIDLIPDLVPVLGLLDDLILVPLGLWIAVRLIPAEILSEHRRTAELAASRPVSRAGLVLVASLWLFGAGLLALWLRRALA